MISKASIKRKARITSKGQMTIPADIRRALGLKQGDTVILVARENEVVLKKAASIEALVGSVPPLKMSWKSARRKAWQARVERLARSSATRTF